MSEINHSEKKSHEAERSSGDNEPKKRGPKAKQKSIKNVSASPHIVFSKKVPPGGVYEITKMDEKNSKGMKRIENAVKLGALEWL